jgi:hypothetical protein
MTVQSEMDRLNGLNAHIEDVVLFNVVESMCHFLLLLKRDIDELRQMQN